jgi:hypothetical protein
VRLPTQLLASPRVDDASSQGGFVGGTRLTLNNKATVVLRGDPPSPATALISAPVRGVGRIYSEVSSAQEPGLVAFLSRAAQLVGEDGEMDAALVGRLQELGLLIPPQQVPRRVEFDCPLVLPSAHHRDTPATSRAVNAEFVLTPNLQVCADPAYPGDELMSRRPDSPFAAAHAWLIVPGAERTFGGIYGLAESGVRLMQQLRAGERSPDELSSPQKTVLENIGGLRARTEDGLSPWTGLAGSASERLRADGYCTLNDLMHPRQRLALRAYFSALVEEGYCQYGDKIVPKRFVLHDDWVAAFFHHQLASFISRLAGVAMKPSYSYMVSYMPGATLPRHVDRRQCEITVALLVDYVPEASGPCPWPLFLEPADRATPPVAIHLTPGEVLIYRGRQLFHFRHALPEGHRSTSLLLHYVPADFAGSLQ